MVKRLWLSRYSVISIGLACANFLVVFGGTNAWSSAPPPVPHSEAYQRLACVGLGLAWGSLGFAALGLWRERPKKLAFMAVAVSLCSFYLCAMRMAL
jgi:uncharacterized membrane protein